MIRGPILPRARAELGVSLRELAARLETGLVPLHDDLAFDESCTVDLLAADAEQRPVLLFVPGERTDGQLAADLLVARDWMARHSGLLARLLDVHGLRLELAPRFVVVVADLTERLAALLRSLPIADLELYEPHSVRAGATRHSAYVRTGHGAERDPIYAAGAGAFTVPSGAVDPQTRELAAQALDTLRRLDPRLQVLGDRCARRFLLPQGCLVELRVADQGLWLDAGGDAALVRTAAELDARLDRVLRRYLELQGLLAPRNAPPPPPAAPPPRLEPAGESLSFATIERSVRSARLSESELAALGQDMQEAVPARAEGRTAGVDPPLP